MSQSTHLVLKGDVWFLHERAMQIPNLLDHEKQKTAEETIF